MFKVILPTNENLCKGLIHRLYQSRRKQIKIKVKTISANAPKNKTINTF